MTDDRVFSRGDAQTADRDTLEREWNSLLTEYHKAKRDRDIWREKAESSKRELLLALGELGRLALVVTGVILGSAVFVLALALAILTALRMFDVV